MDDFSEWSFLDVLTVLSFIIGLQNLELNEKQVKSLDEHLKEQDEKLLAKIIQQNEKIITLLEELKNGRKN